ncbi:hypothetical protein DPMN_121837, partial [Dreissena polymorpha]
MNFTKCKWKIKVPDGHHVVIDSEYFDLEASANCQYDYVRVVDASRNNTFCGKEHLVYVSISNELTVTFTSDNDVSGKGFKFKVTSVPNLTEGRCNSTILAINGQDGDIWNYDKPGNCFYSLEAPAGLTVQITLRFINFGSSSSDEKRIVIRDGVSTHGDHLWKISSGEPLRKKSACANHLFIEYHNQGSTKAVRFYLTYSILTCTTEPATHPPFVEGENVKLELHEQERNCKVPRGPLIMGRKTLPDRATQCIPGSQCDVDLCANGATCVNTRRGDQCFCSGGFTGKLCNETAINDFNVEFEGRYTCVARAGNVTAEHTITLSMDECFLGKLRLRINGPKDTVDYTGRTVILSCSIEEAGDIWWEKDNVTIDIGGQFHVILETDILYLPFDTIWQSKTINNLRIAIAEEQDSGVYTCVARDITGCKNRRSATLTIQNWGKHETYCGKSYPDQINEDRASPLIAMGLNANPKENPWHVSLFSMSFVVTAAHCITDRWTEEQFKASVLIEFASLSCTLDGNEIRRVKFIYIHPQYNKTAPFDSDIALLELSEPVEYSLNIRPICVQSYSKTEKYMIGASYTQGKAVGCGGVQHLGRQSLKLQQWRVGDVCRGDSGGGFMMELPGGFKWVLAGIVSFGFRCNDPDHYSYFTHVGMFYDWIESIAKFNDEKVKLDFLVTTRSDPESVVMHVTNASTVGRDNNCSGIWSDTDEGFTGYILYTAPKYEDNRHCVLVVSTFTNNHVVQVHFNRFEMEGSDSCKFDSLNIYSGEREDSASLGGPYCASSLNGRTILSSGNTMRLVFKTDQSYSFLGFQANFTFLPMDHLDKDCRCSGHEVCVVRGFEKMCIAGSQCKSVSHCENGATCVNNGSVDHCYCTAGYTGNFCTEMAGSAGRLKFTHAPQSRTVKKGGESDNLCQVEKPASGPPVVYSWYFKGRIIGDYQRSSKFGDQGQGLLMIGDFNKQLEGRYTCVARAGNATAEHTFTLTMVEECLLEMQGPSDSDYDTDETAIVFCAAYRAKDVWWEKDNVKIKTESTGKFIKMQNNFLRIAYTATNDSGVYTCVAHDTKGCESRRSARLTVLNRGNYEKYCGIAYTDQVRKYIAQGYISMGDAALPKDNPWHVSLISK